MEMRDMPGATQQWVASGTRVPPPPSGSGDRSSFVLITYIHESYYLPVNGLQDYLYLSDRSITLGQLTR